MNKQRKDLEQTITFFTFMLIGMILTVILIIVKGEYWMYGISGGFIIIGLVLFIINLLKVRETVNLVKKYKSNEFIPKNLHEFFMKEYYTDKIDNHINASSKYDIEAKSLYNIGDEYIDVLIIYDNKQMVIGLNDENVYYCLEELEDEKYDLLRNNLNKMYQLTDLKIFKESVFDKLVYGDNYDFKIKKRTNEFYECFHEIGEFIDSKIELMNKVLDLFEEYKERLE